ncbi:MAG: sugar phosphate isomerase/epimerase [Chloroflexi bacterium]|nr:sugar phosphate isomerase/epimerase [Chloroflexota bacterium]
MYKVLDANLLGIPGAVRELAPLAARYGFEGISLPAAALTDPRAAAEAAACARDYGLKWGLLATPVDFFHPSVEGPALEEGLRTLDRWAATGERLGVARAYNHVWPSSPDKPFAENMAWHVERLERVQAVLRDHGIHYGLEFLGPYELRARDSHSFVHTLAGVLAIADAAGGYTGFLFDTYHWYTGSRRLDDLYLAAARCDRMINVHLNDAVAGLAPDQQRDLIRAMPMTTGMIDAAMIYGLFRDWGYQGPVMCEPMRPTTYRYATMAAEDSIAEVAAAFARVEGREPAATWA